ncbi:MAG: tRNA lysidine(34) synthetase TilS [Gammaproteobacteria bacterium]|nr:tRNA lysidine(34) synthetase TilS [Gammaproteobacteria bacterium]
MNARSSLQKFDFSSSQLVTKLKAQLQDLNPQSLLVAFSGGTDSSVLLHALATHHGDLPAQLTALHVDHGLHPDSGAWRQHCERVCASLNIPFSYCSLQLEPMKGESVEELARVARYEWFSKMMQAGDVLLTAHQRGDQAETVLLQLFRGAGVSGLAAMPDIAGFASGHLLRPLLEFSRDQISQYAHDEQLETLSDPANTDLRFQRNIVRHEVMPLINQHWPGAEKTLVRSAKHCADAANLLDELAQQDLEAATVDTSAYLLSPLPPLRIDLLASLSSERINNLLRYWIKTNEFLLPSLRKLQEAVKQLVDNNTRGGCVEWSNAELRRYREHLFLQHKLSIEKTFPSKSWSATEPFDLHETKVRLQVKPCVSRGLRKSALQGEVISIRPRQGGEQIRLPHAQHRTVVKKLYQTRGIPPWIRERLPLLYIADQLAAIPGIAVDDAFAARHGEESILINVETTT